jgi:hypothetical protein
MSVSPIKFENDKKNNNTSECLKFKLISPKNKNKIMVDEFTSTNEQNFINHKTNLKLQMKCKDYKISLPSIKKRANNNKSKNEIENKSLISKSVNDNYIKNTENDFNYIYQLHYPWANNSYYNKEINKIISNCFCVTKLGSSYTSKINRINDSKLRNKLLRDLEKRYKFGNFYQKIKINKNYPIKGNNENSVSNYNDKYINNIRCFNPFLSYKKNKINNHSNIRNLYFNLNHKSFQKNGTNSRNGRNNYLNDYASSKNGNQSTSYNNSHEHSESKINDNYDIPSHRNHKSKLGNDFKTIKIKNEIKIINNSNIEKNFNIKDEKIKPNSVFMKNGTFSYFHFEKKYGKK